MIFEAVEASSKLRIKDALMLKDDSAQNTINCH